MNERRFDPVAVKRRDGFGRAAFGVFAFALLVRAIHLWQLRAAPFFEMKAIDAKSYDAWAQRIAAGDWLGDAVFFQAPLYPYFLGAVYSTLGDDPLVVRAVQAVIGAAACGLLALAARRFFDPRTGVVAGLMLAVYPAAIFFDSVIQKSVLDLFFLCLCLAALGRLVREPIPSGWLLLGASLGCLVLTRENALVFVLAIGFWLVVHFRPLGPQRWVYGALLAAGLAVVLLPVAARNWVVGGEFHLTTSQFGPNFYLGNNEDATGLYQPLNPGREDMKDIVDDFESLAERELGRELSPGEVSSFYVSRALAFIRANPVDWVALTLRKLALTWNALEIPDTEDQYSYAAWSLPLRVSGAVWHFGVLAPLAVAGVGITWRRRRELWLLYLMVAVYTASVALFYVFGRYRFPLVPLLLPFAAAAATQLPRFAREASTPQRASVVGAFVATAVFCNWTLLPRDNMQAGTDYNLAVSLVSQGKHSEALPYLERTLAVRPDSTHANLNMGVALEALGRGEEAVAYYEAALRVWPASPDANLRLGSVKQAGGELEAAAAHYQLALDSRPDDATAHDSLGQVLALEGRHAEAIEHFRRAVALAPEFALPIFHLGHALAQRGDTQAAIEQYERALELSPRSPKVELSLGNALIAQQRFAEAVEHYERALELAPAMIEVHNNLAFALARVGRHREARAHLMESRRLTAEAGAAGLPRSPRQE